MGQDSSFITDSLSLSEKNFSGELLNKSRFDPLKTTILINLDRDFQSLFNITLPKDFFKIIAENVLYDDIQRLTFELLKYLSPKVRVSITSTLFNPETSGSSALMKFKPT